MSIRQGVVLAVIALRDKGVDDYMGINIISIHNSGNVHVHLWYNIVVLSDSYSARAEAKRGGRRFLCTREEIRNAVGYFVVRQS